MRVNDRTTLTLQNIALVSVIFVAGVGLTACGGQVKDPQMEKFKQGIQEQAAKEAQEPKLDVLIIKRDMKEGDVFKEEDLIPHQMPKSRVPAGALSDAKSAIGKKVAHEVKLGSVLTGAAVSP